MKSVLAKIFFGLPFVVYGVLALSFFLFQLEFTQTFWTKVFLFTLFFGWILVLASAIISIVFRFKDKEKRGVFFFGSIINCAVSVFWGGFMLRILFLSPFAAPIKPKPVYDLTWHLLDDSLSGNKFEFTFEDYKDFSVARNVTAGKTKKVRLPDDYFQFVKSRSDSDGNAFVFLPETRFELYWNSKTYEYEKKDTYEIIVYKKPVITEDDEKFSMQDVPKDSDFALCYWDKDRGKFVYVDSSDGVFWKKDSSDDLLLDGKKDYPDSDEQFNLFMSVKSCVREGERHAITISYDREKRFLPVKNYRTYVQNATYSQNGREIKTLNLELDGTNWIKTQFTDKRTGKPLANKKVVIYVIFEGDNTNRKIYTESDDDGYVCVENIPDGAECYIDFLE